MAKGDIEKELENLKKEVIGETHKEKLMRLLKKYDGMQVIVELLVGIGLGLLIGYKLDSYCGTKVIFSFVFTILSTIASIVNIYRNLK